MAVEETSVKQTSPLFNKDILLFFLKLIALVVVWECSYNFILQPSRIPDKALTDIISAGTTGCINLFSSASSKYTWLDSHGFVYIYQNGTPVFYIADACNGLSLLAIYVGFIVLLPYPITRKIIFSLAGIAGLIMANIIRCSLLYWIFKKRADLFDFTHHYVFTILMYILIFFGWYLFTKKKPAKK